MFAPWPQDPKTITRDNDYRSAGNSTVPGRFTTEAELITQERLVVKITQTQYFHLPENTNLPPGIKRLKLDITGASEIKAAIKLSSQDRFGLSTVRSRSQ